MTLACAIMAITISLQWRRIKQQEKLISDFNEKGFREVLGYGKVYRRRYIFVNIENAGDNDTLNRLVKQMEDDGYKYSYEDTLDNGILAFVKLVEVKPGFKD